MGYGQVGHFQGRQVIQVHPRAIRDLRKGHRTVLSGEFSWITLSGIQGWPVEGYLKG